MAKRSYSQSPDRFSRQWWISTIQNCFWVTVVTVLVWVYADMEFTDEEPLKATLMLVVSKDTDLKILSNPVVRIDFKIKANRKILDGFKRWLNSRGGIIEYDVSKSFRPGKHTISTAEILKSATGRRAQGATLTVMASSAPTVTVRLDRLLRKTLRVEFAYTGADLDKTIKLDPAEVTVRVGQADWEKIEAEWQKTHGSQPPVVTTVSTNLTNVAAGVKTSRTVQIVGLIAGIRVEPDVREVTAAFTIIRRTRSKEITVAVGVKMPPAWGEDDTWIRYILKRKDPAEWLAKITVSGPQKDLEQLSAAGKVTAYVVLSDDDRKPVDSWLKREVVVELPRGLQVEMTSPSPTVQFKLIDREKVVAPPGG